MTSSKKDYVYQCFPTNCPDKVASSLEDLKLNRSS